MSAPPLPPGNRPPEQDMPFFHGLGMNSTDLSLQRREAKGRLPTVQILKLDHEMMQFAVSNTDVSVVNALRRIIYSEVCICKYCM